MSCFLKDLRELAVFFFSTDAGETDLFEPQVQQDLWFKQVERGLQESFFNCLYTNLRPCHQQMCMLLTNTPHLFLKTAQLGIQFAHF